jgi:peptidyl-prolyl cis-trans isomerase SurA
MTYRNLVRPVAVAVAVLAFLAPVARSEILEQVLVKVNGEIFTKTDLETRQVSEIRQRGKQIDLSTAQGNEELRKAIAEVTPGLLVNVVDEMLIVQRGKELGYRVGEDQFKSILDNLKTQNKIESDEQLVAALKQENMTMADLRKNLERTVIAQRVQQAEVFGRVALTEDEAHKYYDAHMAEFTTPSSVMLREILINVPADARGINAGADDAAKARAEEIRKRAVAGEAFEKLATEVSDSASKANGGLIGPLNMNEISADFRKVIEGLKPGEMTPPIRTARGYQILRLESSTPTKILEFDKAREQISERVFTDKRRDEYQKYLVKLRAQAIIDWRNQDVKKAYEEGLALQAKATSSPAAPPQ